MTALPSFGMAGVIYTDGAADSMQMDEQWLTGAFGMTGWTTRTEWRSDDALIVTSQHAHEAGTAPGSIRISMPEAMELRGLVYGHFYGLPRSKSDRKRLSENLLCAYSQTGPKCFREVNGAWIAIIWDQYTKRVQFARDVMGVEVLYVSRLVDRIVFSTDTRILETAGLPQNMDEQALAEFLHYFYVPAPRTMTQACVAVLPGHILSSDTLTYQESYATSRYVPGPSLADEQRVEREIEDRLPEFEARLLDAVGDCVPEEGRIALTLSGGKDSSSIAVALSKICPDRVVALTVGLRGSPVDETHDAALVCRALGLAHQIYDPTDRDLEAGLADFARVQDQPVGDLAALPYFLGMSSLPEDCTLVLDGTGNDAYFGTPDIDRGVWHYSRRRQLEAIVPRVMWQPLMRLMSHGPAGIRRLSHFWSRPLEETFVTWEGWTATELSELLRREVSFEDTYLWREMRSGDAADWQTLLTNVLNTVWEPHAAIRKAVHFARATGRGIRMPFIDSRLATFVNNLPAELKFQRGANKQLLRAYMKRNLPREIVEKPKRGFIFDVDRLLRSSTFRWADELIRSGTIHLARGWSQTAVHRLLDRYSEAPRDEALHHRLYALCLLATVLAERKGVDLRLPSGT